MLFFKHYCSYILLLKVLVKDKYNCERLAQTKGSSNNREKKVETIGAHTN
jgi:hypothetical protein